MDGTPDPDAMFALFGDEYVRTIVRAASRRPMSVKELSDECDSALSTVYRRVDDLVDVGILVERTKIEPDGSHHAVYETALDEFTVQVSDGEMEVTIAVEHDPAEQFARIWEGIRGA